MIIDDQADRTQQQWMSKAFWRDFCPDLHIEHGFENATTQLETTGISADGLRQLIRTEGYFQLPPADWQLPLKTMAGVVSRLADEGMPTALAFVYDEFWALSVKLTTMLEGLLGPGFLRLPDFWAWNVDPARDDSGWRPHRDKGYASLRPDRSAKSLTVWLPLTESTTLNGCIYILPADRDPVYATPNDKNWHIELPEIRALPAQPGAIFVWTQAVLHWGSHTSRRADKSRVSVAFEFQANDIPPYNQPLMEPMTVPVFDARLKLIAKQILQYQHMYPLEPIVAAVAQRLAP